MRKASLLLPKGWTTEHALLAFQMREYAAPSFERRLKKDFLKMAGNGSKRWKLFEAAFMKRPEAKTRICDYKEWPVLGYDSGGQVPGYVDQEEERAAKFVIETLFAGPSLIVKKRAQFIAELNAMKLGDDAEECHARADEILMLVLESMDEGKLVEAYKAARRRIEFWYA